jgi:hypothetical protein
MCGKEFGLLLQIRRLHLTPLDSGWAGLKAGVWPASSAAPMSLYLGSGFMSLPLCCRGEHEQRKRVRMTRGISASALS